MKNGRAVRQIWWNGADGDETLKYEKGRAILRSTYYGDHTENWICIYDENGKEVARHNTAYISSIVWE